MKYMNNNNVLLVLLILQQSGNRKEIDLQEGQWKWTTRTCHQMIRCQLVMTLKENDILYSSNNKKKSKCIMCSLVQIIITLITSICDSSTSVLIYVIVSYAMNFILSFISEGLHWYIRQKVLPTFHWKWVAFFIKYTDKSVVIVYTKLFIPVSKITISV